VKAAPARLHIGPIAFTLQGAASVSPIRYPSWPYDAFLRPPPGVQPARELLVDVSAPGRPAPSRPPEYAAGRNWACWREGDARVLAAGWQNRAAARFLCRVDRRLRRAELFVDGDPSDAPLRYPLDQVLSWGLLARCGGALLHAAGVERAGVGRALAGRSGAGKSTLSGLCAGEGWQVLNDDRVMVYPDAAGWRVAGTPWHGSGRFAVNRSVPLAALHLLQQDRRDVAERLTANDARLALLEVASVPWFDEEWSQGALNAIAALTGDVPVFRLRFTRSPGAIRALESAA